MVVTPGVVNEIIDTSIKLKGGAEKPILMKEIPIKTVKVILKFGREGILGPRQIMRFARVSKSTYYRVLRRYADVQDLRTIKTENRKERRQGRLPAQLPPAHVRKILEYRIMFRANANALRELLKAKENISLSHYAIYKTLRSADMVNAQGKKKRRNKWVRFERKHSLSLWQTDWTALNGKHLIVILDDASRLVVGWGLFGRATTDNSLKVLKEAIRRYGKPKAMLTGRDVQFYCSEKYDGGGKGRNDFQLFLEANGIQHILARVNHPQTCGKIERFFGEVKTRINRWKDFATVDEVVQWHNELKPHMSLDFDNLETPVQAFQRKMHYKRNVDKTFVKV